MTGPEHYREAEAAIEAAWDRDTDDSRRALLLADAQVHATLAMAAASASYGMFKTPAGHDESWGEVLA